MKNQVFKFRSFIKEYVPFSMVIYQAVRKATGKEPRQETWLSLLTKLKATTSDIFFLEVGAMDGVSFDPLHEHIVANGWRGMLIEPLPDMFAELKHLYRNHDGLIFENVAIADEPGTRTMLRVPTDAIKQGLVPSWAKGISSFYEDRNELGSADYSATVVEQIQRHTVRETVRCDTLNNLFSKNNIKKIDIVQIDVEGYDYHVIKQFDFRRFKPAVIRMEWCTLPAAEQQLCRELFRNNGYETLELSDDLLAWPRTTMLERLMNRIRGIGTR